MKICYIRPKTTKQKPNQIKLYSLSGISSLFLYIAHYADPELQIIIIINLLLAIIVAAQKACDPIKSKAEKKREEMDNKLKEHDRKKKIKAMLEDEQDSYCKNVNVKKLI